MRKLGPVLALAFLSLAGALTFSLEDSNHLHEEGVLLGKIMVVKQV